MSLDDLTRWILEHAPAVDFVFLLPVGALFYGGVGLLVAGVVDDRLSPPCSPFERVVTSVAAGVWWPVTLVGVAAIRMARLARRSRRRSVVARAVLLTRRRRSR